jgi:predicted esterase
VLFFHGAGGSAAQMLSLFAPFADTHGFIVAAPSSGGQTWDVILSDYGPDVAAVDRLLAEVFARHPVDPRRVAAAGFSDGASYALSLGLANGNLFSHVIAFSPGFMVPRRAEGTPFVFVSHGAEDPVLPIARCSRRIVPALQNAGYPVRYVEFPDGHAVPPEVCDEACLWFRETG